MRRCILHVFHLPVIHTHAALVKLPKIHTGYFFPHINKFLHGFVAIGVNLYSKEQLNISHVGFIKQLLKATDVVDFHVLLRRWLKVLKDLTRI
ncbi:hypothetical protein D3C86_1960040 [compost metagenome]